MLQKLLNFLAPARKQEDALPKLAEASGPLNLAKTPGLRSLPAGLSATSIDLSDCTSLESLPPGLRLRSLKLNNCTSLRELPDDLECQVLEARNTGLRSLPASLRVAYRLDLSGCDELEALPRGLSVGTLNLRNCSRLEALPEDLNVYFLDIGGCSRLGAWPERGTLRYGHLRAQNCDGLTELPPWLGNISQLDLRGCSGIRSLPPTLRVNAWVDVAGTAIAELPPSLAGLPLRWRGVPVDERIAFHPESITVEEILAEANVERRRVLLERMGYAAFLSRAEAQILDQDEDPGGERRLLRVPQPRDEDLVCLAVYCPSTGRQYVLRVPPAMHSCRQAAAWIAGFDNVDDFQPIAET